MASPWLHSNGPLWMTAVVSGLFVVMLLAVIAPRLFDTEGTGWVVSLVAGVVVAGAIIAYGYAKRNAGETERHESQQ
jgi:positive regulator of sigma E activity